MWIAFKALSWQIKAGILIGLLAILVAITGSAYYIGYNKGENISKVEIAKYESRVKDLIIQRDKAQAKVDVRVVTEYKDRIQYVDRVVTKTNTVIRDNVPEQQNLSKGWVHVYNQSVAGKEPSANLAADSEPSGTSDRAALYTITENNGICLANKAQLDSLQQWVRETEEAQNEVTKK